MSWQEVKILTLKHEFVLLAQREGCNFSLLCAYFNISRKTGYKWLNRFKEYGAVGLEELSRRPHSSPNTTEAAIEKAVLDVRGTEHQKTWGGRKIRRHLRDEGKIEKIPAASTITEILISFGKHQPERLEADSGVIV